MYCVRKWIMLQEKKPEVRGIENNGGGECKCYYGKGKHVSLL